jgi:hypothetical protein
MKRLLFVMLAFFALSCGDGSNNRSQSEAEDIEENDDALLEDDDAVREDSLSNDETDMETDTTSADGSRRQ